MSNFIYLFKTQRLNMFEIAGAQIIKNAPDQFYNICDYILEDKFLKIRALGEIVTNFLPRIEGNYRNFRNVDWQSSQDYLDSIINTAFKQGKHLMFGTNSLEQYNFIVAKYQDRCCTLAVTYTQGSYPALLEHLVDHHIHLLKTSGIEITPQDKFNLENLTLEELKQYYLKSFDEQELLPACFNLDSDYTIDYLDLINPQKFNNWLETLGFPFTNTSIKFYEDWLRLNGIQQKLFDTHIG